MFYNFTLQVEEHKTAYKELMKSAHERQLRMDADLKRIEKEIIEKDDARKRSEDREREAVMEQERLKRQLRSLDELHEQRSGQISTLEATQEELARLKLANAELSKASHRPLRSTKLV